MLGEFLKYSNLSSKFANLRKNQNIGALRVHMYGCVGVLGLRFVAHFL